MTNGCLGVDRGGEATSCGRICSAVGALLASGAETETITAIERMTVQTHFLVGAPDWRRTSGGIDGQVVHAVVVGYQASEVWMT